MNTHIQRQQKELETNWIPTMKCFIFMPTIGWDIQIVMSKDYIHSDLFSENCRIPLQLFSSYVDSQQFKNADGDWK